MNQKIEKKIEQAWFDGKISDADYFAHQDALDNKLPKPKTSLWGKIKAHKFLTGFIIASILVIINYIAIYSMTPEHYAKVINKLIDAIATNPITIIFVLILAAPILLPAIFASKPKPTRTITTHKRPDGDIDIEVWDNEDNK